MLTGMLLHVVKAAGPVHAPGYWASRKRVGQDVDDPLSFVHYVGNLDSTQIAGVKWLPARSRVKGGAVEVNPPTVVTSFQDGGFELAEIGIGVVQSVGHGEPNALERGLAYSR
jgi:hypothetical protein